MPCSRGWVGAVGGARRPRVKFSEAACFEAVLCGPTLPFGHLFFEARPPTSEGGEDAFGSGFEPFGSAQACFSRLMVAASGEPPVSTELVRVCIVS